MQSGALMEKTLPKVPHPERESTGNILSQSLLQYQNNRAMQNQQILAPLLHDFLSFKGADFLEKQVIF